jgi:MarR family transcriptional regulator for hemolysin
MDSTRRGAAQALDDPKSWAPESVAAFWINRASRAMIKNFDARLKTFGFAMSHIPVLRALANGASLSQKNLAEIARVEQPTMAEMLARMERDGVIERRPDPDDKRATLISLTRRSRARIPKAKVALMEREREAMEGLTAAEKNLVSKLMERVALKAEAAP